jgi:ParB-like chromosome segregation protein Spo0J
MRATADLRIVQVPINELRTDPANPRRIGDAELDTLTKSMRVHGFVLPILARLEDKTVIGGHPSRRGGWG